MKNTALLLLSLLICALAACRKNLDLNLPSRPCADVVVDEVQLAPAWNWPEGDLSSIRPAVFDQQVVFSRIMKADETELLGFDGTSGQLLWQSTVPAHLFGKKYRQIGSRLYFANETRTALLSFDIATRQLETAWKLPAQEILAFQFAVQEGFAVCPTMRFMAEIDSLEFALYLINLQSGLSREVLRFRTRFGNHDRSLLDPQATVTSSGDTLCCFVNAEYGPAFSFAARFVSLNVSTGIRTENSALAGSYSPERGNLVVEGDRAWLLAADKLQCLDAATGTILWQVDGSFEGYALLVRAGKVFALGYTRQAFDAATGAALWGLYGHSFYGEDLTTSFVRDGQLWLNQESNLRSFDLETGCLTRDYALPSTVGELVYNMALSPDGQRIYFSSHKDEGLVFDQAIFLAAPLPQ